MGCLVGTPESLLFGRLHSVVIPFSLRRTSRRPLHTVGGHRRCTMRPTQAGPRTGPSAVPRSMHIRVFSRSAHVAGLVILRLTFVRRCHQWQFDVVAGQKVQPQTGRPTNHRTFQWPIQKSSQLFNRHRACASDNHRRSTSRRSSLSSGETPWVSAKRRASAARRWYSSIKGLLCSTVMSVPFSPVL